MDRTCRDFSLDLLAGAGAGIGRLPVDLERRIGRRDLLDLAGEAGERGFDLARGVGRTSLVATTSPSASSVSVSSPKRIVNS